MIIRALLKQAEDFDFKIYQSVVMSETNFFSYPELDRSTNYEAEEALFDSENYEYWSQRYDEDSDPWYTVAGNVGNHYESHEHLSEDEILPVLEKMVMTELHYQYNRFANFVSDDYKFEGMSGLAIYLALDKIPENKRNLPLYEYDGNCGDQFAVVDLDKNGFRIATQMGTNTAAYNESKLLTINDVLSKLDNLPVEVLINPIKAIDLETGETDFINSIDLFDDDAEMSETNQLAINVNLE